MKSLIALIFLLQSGFASQATNSVSIPLELVTYNPMALKPGNFVLSFKDYQDIRIDTDLDGKIDYWFVKKGPVEITTTYANGSPKTIYGKRIEKNYLTEFLFEKKNGKMILSIARKRKIHIWAGFETHPINLLNSLQACAGTKNADSTIDATIKLISDDMMINQIDNTLIDPSCKSKLQANQFVDLKTDLESTLPTGDDVSSCLKREADKNPQAKILLQKWNLQKYELSKEKKPVFLCNEDSKSDKIQASANEGNGDITFYQKQLPKGDALTTLINHELLHRIGLSEDDVHKVEKCDITNINISFQQVENLKNNVSKDIAGEGVTPINSKSSQDQAGQNATTNVASQFQNAKPITMPPAEKLSEVIDNPPQKTDAGIDSAIMASTSDSSGVLRSANSLLGSISNVADAAPASDNSTNTSSLNRGLASVSSGNPGSDEHITEEIDLTKGAQASPSSVGSYSGGASSLPVPNNGSIAPVAAAKSVSRAAVSGVDSATTVAASATGPSVGTPTNMGGSTKLMASSGSGASGPGRATSARAPASATGAGTSKDEVITFFTKGDYAQVKKKLADPQFNALLTNQGISVLDLYGGVKGAPKGNTVILDEGDRFVQQTN